MANAVRFDTPPTLPEVIDICRAPAFSKKAGSRSKSDLYRMSDPLTPEDMTFKHIKQISRLSYQSSVDSELDDFTVPTAQTASEDVSRFGSAPGMSLMSQYIITKPITRLQVPVFPDMPPPPPTLLIGQIWRLLLFLL